jgi:CBS domain-containing protein
MPCCRNVMTENLQYITPMHTIQMAAAIMRAANVGYLPVCDDDGRAIGVITDRDIVVRSTAENIQPSDMVVEEIMTREVICCAAGDSLERAERLMSKKQLSRIMVCDEDGHLVGVVSIADIAGNDSHRHTARTLRKIVSRERRP